ncbi:MAG: HAMP domain-containing histidine kinase, partial [Anaerolineae bacterium]|nr:HAMP domain-containing histidine kinase [Anaerolineae bacterium]
MAGSRVSVRNTIGVQAEAEELKQEVIVTVALMLVLLGGMAAATTLPDLYFGNERALVFLSLFAEGFIAYFCRRRYPLVSRIVLLFGPIFSLWLALRVFSSPFVPFFSLLIVIANYAISPRLGFTAAILSTACLGLSLPFAGELFSAIVLLWLTTGVQWVSSKGLYVALAWAWNSEERASGLLEELRLQHEELKRTVVALTETTHRLERTGYELAVARLRAEEARQMKEQFAANISHELRTPLNLIMGFSEMIYLTPDVYGRMKWPTTLKQDVLQIYQSSRQLLDLINDVIDLARIDRVQMPLRAEKADLLATIQEAMSTIGGLMRGREAKLEADLPASLPTLSFDRTRIRQVLLNLLSNAARFTEKGSITVAVEVKERECVVSVADSGIGIPPEELPRIFDEFHQVDRSLRRRREGAGLGLAISRRFVELHGGRIWAESEVGKGSTFYFSLPL